MSKECPPTVNYYNKFLNWSLVIGLLVIAPIVIGAGCGQVNPASDTTATTTTTLPASITLSGSLQTGTFGSSSVKSYSAAVANYTVVAIDNSSGKTYYSSSDATGNFSLIIPSGISYEVSLINDSASYFGPIVIMGNTSSSEVVMGITPVENKNLGTIVVDSTNKVAELALEPTAIANLNDAANASSGIPKGAGSCGKNVLCTTTREGSDMDKDGIPNIFDADEDGDQIRNGILKLASNRIVNSNTVEAIYVSSNIWSMRGVTDEAKDQIAMWLNVTTPNDTALNQISSIQVIDVPSSIKNIAIIRVSSSIGYPESYPTENSLWKDSGYHLYKTTTLARNQYIVSLCPKAIMNVGDTFTVRVTYTSGGYQDFFLTTPYVLTDWARILSCNGTNLTTNEGQNTTTEAVQFSTSTLEIVISKVKDEDGNILAGLDYSVIIGTSEASGSDGHLNVPPGTSIEYRSYQYSSAFTDGTSTVTVSLDKLFTFETGKYYYITPVAESADGQRNGEQAWFKNQ